MAAFTFLSSPDSTWRALWTFLTLLMVPTIGREGFVVLTLASELGALAEFSLQLCTSVQKFLLHLLIYILMTIKFEALAELDQNLPIFEPRGFGVLGFWGFGFRV